MSTDREDPSAESPKPGKILTPPQQEGDWCKIFCPKDATTGQGECDTFPTHLGLRSNVF